jgi:UDPglucose--hexose-1-phosphate uridylyltransferase
MELRKDYVLDRWAIIATERSKRPKQFKHEDNGKDEKECFFCQGKEHLTPPEIGRVPDADSWKVRWFPNKFPAVEAKGNFEIRTDNEFFTHADAYGYHEVVAETPHHEKQLWDLSKEELYVLYTIYKHRTEELSKLDNIRYVTIFKNHGAEGGTSLVHSHTQIAATAFVPQIVLDKSRFCRDGCAYCKIIEIEKNSTRRCFENDRFVAFAPYASRFNLEIWIFPREHLRSFSEFSDEHFRDLADIMFRILGRLKEIDASYNYYVHHAPQDENLHFHIEVIPRLAKWAGFEFATGIVINSITPEDAAEFYRG